MFNISKNTKFSYYMNRNTINSYLEDIIFLDIETTGLDSQTCEIIEIGAIKIKKNEIIVFETLVNPNGTIPKEILNLCEGLNKEDFDTAPIWDDVAIELKEFLEDLPIVCHNTQFEISFLKRFLDNNILNTNEFLDSMELAMLISPGCKEFNLQYLINTFLNTDRKEKHRGLSDSLDTIEVVNQLLEILFNKNLYCLKNINKYLKTWNWYKHIKKVKRKIKILDKDVIIEKSANKEIITDKIEIDLNLYENLLKDEELWSSKTSTYEFRRQQYEMSKSVRKSLQDKNISIIEAKTGTGKSISYILASLIYSYLNKKPIYISTHTKTLQSQLVEKDIPVVIDILGLNDKVKIIELKGKNNYICKDTFENIKRNITLNSLSNSEKLGIVYIANLIETGEYGDIEQINYSAKKLLKLDNLLDLAKIEGETKCNSGCKHFKKCYYKNLTSQLGTANLVVINHSLLTNWPYNSEGYEIKKIIIDEAHNLEDSIRQSYTVEINAKEIIKKFRYLISNTSTNSTNSTDNKKGLLMSIKGLDLISLNESIKQLEYDINEVSRNLELLLKNEGELYEEKRVCYMNQNLRSSIYREISFFSLQLEYTYSLIIDSIANLKTTNEAYFNSLDKKFVDLIRETIKELKNINKSIRNYMNVKDDKHCCSLTIDKSINNFILEVRPIKVDEIFKKNFLDNIDNVVFTSATISIEKNNLGYFKSVLGINNPMINKNVCEIQLDDVYDYRNKAIIAIPTDSPKFFDGKKNIWLTPQEIGEYISNLTLNILKNVTCNILILTTSKQRLEAIKNSLVKNIGDRNINIITNKKELSRVNNFKQNNTNIILGSKSFFEGLNLPGDTLNCVILEKMPNLVPTDPLVKSLYTNGYTYKEINTPKVSLNLQQAFGRLIRSNYDYGYFFILNGVNSNNIKLVRDIKNKKIQYDREENILKEMCIEFRSWRKHTIQQILKEYVQTNGETIYLDKLNLLFLNKNINCTAYYIESRLKFNYFNDVFDIEEINLV